MARKRDRRSPHRRWFVHALGLFLIGGCETAHTPVAPVDVVEQLPPGITSKTSLVGDAAHHAWIRGLTQELEDVDRQLRSVRTPSQELLRRAEKLREAISEARTAASGVKGLTPRTTEASDEDAGITSYGTQIGMPDGGPFRVTAHTSTSRVTGISHAIRIVKTTPGREYSTGVTDRTGMLGSNHLYTTVGVSGDCSVYTTLDAATQHTAGAIGIRTQTAFSTASASCGTPPSCGGDGDGPGGEIITSVMPAEGPSLSCSGGGPGGDTGGGGTTYRCYTVTTHHYWYYPDTNTYEYRYSEESTWCEELG